MEIKNVRMMKAEEVLTFRESLRKLDKRDMSINYCQSKFDWLIEKHKQFKDDHKQFQFNKYCDYLKKLNEGILIGNIQFQKVIDGESILCACGSKLRLVKTYNFVGCPNYKDKGYKHLSYNKSTPCDMPIYTYFSDVIGKNYLNKFKTFYKVPKYVMPSILYKYIIKVGQQIPYVDINEDYFNTVVTNRIKSKSEESIIFEILKKKFKIVIPQPHFIVTYDKGNEIKIPDFLCSNETNVLIVEVKKSLNNIDNSKLKLYKNIIKWFMLLENDNRILNAINVFYEDVDNGHSDKHSIHVKNLLSW